MTFAATLDQLHAIIDWLLKELSSHAFDKKRLRNIELAVEEAVVNIINHGYKTKPGNIDIQVRHLPAKVEIVIEDQAPPFNPLEHSKEIDRTQIGGLGIHMMKKCVDHVAYHRANDRNVLILSLFLVGR